MFVWRFCRVVAAEAYDTTWKLIEVVEYQYHSAQGYFKTQKTKRGLKKNMKNAPSYSEWKKHAQEYDKLQESDLWKETNESNLYDWHYIEHITDILRDSREKGDYMAVIHTIRSNATRNLGNILDSQLYSGSYVGTKHVIERFHNEMTACLDYIVSLPHSKLPKSKKLEFFAETRQAFGKTALIFSGGGGMGKYHLGVIKCLYEEGLLPRVIAGSSIGSVFACFLGTKTPEELEDIFVPERMDFSAYNKRQKFSLLKNLKSLIKHGYLIDPAIGRDYMRGNIGDITFQEAYDKTGFILNITTTGQGPYDSCKLLNYLTAPNVVIWSAVCASCALPYIFGPMELYCKDEYGQIKLYMPEDKKFVDGSISADVPTQYLSEMFNVNCFIVSQVNPWIVPFLKHSEHLRHSPFTFLHRVFEIIKDLIGSEIQHRFNQLTRIGIFPKAIARYFNLVTQTYCGHVTIFPKPTLYDFLTLVNDPSPEAMRQGLEGRKSVYPKINRISVILEVEKSIDKNYQLIKTAIEKKISLDEVEELEKNEDFVDRETIFTTDIDEDLESRKLSSPFQVPRSFSSELLKSVTRSLSIAIPNNNIPVTE